ncbi:MAG: hypothetical protein QOD33_226 [Pyrinomonadaceae bacterium]|jgi:hypothetical protein|nr:hypothetical protein [Pyrinomonadaceae bacterium]
MNIRTKSIARFVALLLACAVAQVYSGMALAQTAQPAVGSLSVQGGKAISVNGASTITGATIFSGASIETPAGVGSTVNLGNGSVDIEPGTKLSLEFQDGLIKVTLIQGCATVHANAGTTGEIDRPQGTSEKTDPKAQGVLHVCNPEVGAVRTAPASAAGQGGLFGLGTAATIAIIAGAGSLFGLPLIFPNANPSPTAP